MQRDQRKSIMIALFAHTISKYDVFLFGFLAPIIKPIFFVGSDLITSLSAFATFAAGYFMRPLGAILFSHIGDRKGRKLAFLLTVILMAVPTVIIGFLPGYNQIGILAPIILIISRLMHGLCSGGEFSGLTVYISEFVPAKNLGFFGGIVRAVGFLGTAIGTLLASIMTLSMMPSWGWRVTFIIGAVFTFISYRLRKNMLETPDFEGIKKEKKIKNVPFLELIKNYKPPLFYSFCISASAYIFLYLTTVYLNSLYIEEFKLSNSQSLSISTFIMIVWMCLTPLAGYMADKFGTMKYLKLAFIVSICVCLPIYYVCYLFKSKTSYLCLQILLSIIGAAIFGPVPGLMKQFFKTDVRYSGISLSNTLAQAILGGMTPFYSVLLISTTKLEYAPAFLLIFASIFGYYGLTKYKNLKHYDI